VFICVHLWFHFFLASVAPNFGPTAPSCVSAMTPPMAAHAPLIQYTLAVNRRIDLGMV